MASLADIQTRLEAMDRNGELEQVRGWFYNYGGAQLAGTYVPVKRDQSELFRHVRERCCMEPGFQDLLSTKLGLLTDRDEAAQRLERSLRITDRTAWAAIWTAVGTIIVAVATIIVAVATWRLAPDPTDTAPPPAEIERP